MANSDLPGPERQRGWMIRLTQTDPTPARKVDMHKGAPSSLCRRVKSNVVRLQRCKNGLQVWAHEIQLVRGVSLCRVHRKLGRWQREDQPTAASVDGRELKDVAEKCTVSVDVLAVDNDMCAVYHLLSPPRTRALRASG